MLTAKPYSVEKADCFEREQLSAAVYQRLAKRFSEDALTEEEENEMLPDRYVAFEYDEVLP